MIVARTDHSTGRRHYEVPQALADVAMALFPDDDQTGAVFHLARRLSWHDVHTLENIAIHDGHDKAVNFARECLQPAARH